MTAKNKQEVTRDLERISILAEDGSFEAKDLPELSQDKLLELYRWMVLSREADGKMLKLQRQGRIGTFPPITGQEAVSCASALAMRPRDWLVGNYRDLGARLMRGDTLLNAMTYYNGFEEGSAVSREKRILPVQVILGSQVPHAVGIAYAMQMKGEKDSAVVTFFGDGASSQGDVHEAMNFAGVWKSPVVFVLVNNGWAISTPLCKQSATKDFASRGVGYGMPAMQVDGNDPLAMYVAVKKALERARRGEGPTLIEAVTYRLMMHTTADDPTKYRTEEEVKIWWTREPLVRFRKFLEAKGCWDGAKQEKLEAEVRAEIDAAVATFEKPVERKLDAPFDHVLGGSNGWLETQRGQFKSRHGLAR